jgi:methylglutaconyl-CoA hydratase
MTRVSTMEADEPAEAAVADGVWSVTLTAPSRRNALSAQLLARLSEALDAVEQDPDARVLVLAARGAAFCAGADLEEQLRADEAARVAAAVSLGRLLARLRRITVPVVAVVQGHARGGGLGLIAAADIAIAATPATFGFAEIRIGVAPAVIAPLVLEQLDRRAAAELFLTGATFDARQAAEIGLITRVVEAEALSSERDRTVLELLRGNAHAAAVCKQLLSRVHPGPDDDGASYELARLSAEMFSSAEAQEGIQAIRSRRAPLWMPTVARSGDTWPAPERWRGRGE